MFDPMKNLRIGPDQVFEKFGVSPDRVVDVQALCGDSVDNVPGAPGIGIKTASALITEYGDLDTVLARAGEIKQDKRRQTLIDFADQIRLSRELVRLDCNTPLPAPIDDLEVAEPDAAGPAATSWTPWSSAPWPGGWSTIQQGGGSARADRLTAVRACRTQGDRHQRLCPGPRPGRAGRLDRAGDGRSARSPSTPRTEQPLVLGPLRPGRGVSLAVAPGEACYIPLGHEEAEVAGPA